MVDYDLWKTGPASVLSAGTSSAGSAASAFWLLSGAAEVRGQQHAAKVDFGRCFARQNVDDCTGRPAMVLIFNIYFYPQLPCGFLGLLTKG